VFTRPASHNERCQARIQRLKEGIGILAKKQAAPEKMATLFGMTIDDSERYKRRRCRIKRLTQELAEVDGQQISTIAGSPS
jgi:hypothetical protein